MFLPALPAHASSAALSLSETSGYVGDTLTVTGTGFTPSSSITLTFDTYTCASTGTCVFAGVDSLLVSSKLTTEADGFFSTQITVPTLVGGSYTVEAKDGSSVTATTTFTIEPSMSLCDESTSSCTGTHVVSSVFVGQDMSSTYLNLYGFGKSESVTVVGTVLSNSGFSVTTSSTGYYSAKLTDYISIIAGATYKVTSTGGTSNGVASASLTVDPVVAFYPSQTGATTMTIAAYNGITGYIAGWGFPSKASIGANSITIGGTTAGNAATTVGTDGTFGVGGSNHLAFTITLNTLGLVSAVVDGTTFSYGNGNIVCPTAYNALCDAWSTPQPSSSGSMAGTGYGAPLISSSSGGTAQITTDASSYRPTEDYVSVFGSGGFTAAPSTSVALSSNELFYNGPLDQPSYTPLSGSSSGTTPASFWSITSTSAIVASDISTLNDAPSYDTTGTAVTYTITASGGSTSAATTTISITPYMVAGGSSDTDSADITTSFTVVGHGFGNAESIHVTFGGVSVTSDITSGLTTGSNGAFTSSSNKLDQYADLASGAQSLVATGATSGASATDSVTIYPIAYYDGTTSALSSTSGAPGTTVYLRTGTSSGIHGLNASTEYEVTFGAASGSTILANFTTTSSGGIAVPGLAVTIPAGTTGYHILTIRTMSGTDVLFNDALAETASSISSTLTGQYGDLLFNEKTTVTATPSAGNVGGTVTLTGSGLAAASSYVVSFSTSSSTAGTVGLATFTTTATGAVPAATSITIPATATTEGTSTVSGENGTLFYIDLSTTTNFQKTSSNVDGYATFVLQASATLNTTSAAPGAAVKLTAAGLAATVPYNVKVGTNVVGAFVSDSNGAGSVSFTIPSGMALGSYQVKLINSNNKESLISPPTLTVTSSSTSSTFSTSTFSTTTSPSEATVNGQATISGSFSNSYSSSVSVYMWVSVMNSAGQTVAVYLGSATVASGSTATIGAALFNLPSGSYTAQVFLTTTSGIVVSTTSTTSSFTV